MARYFPKCFIFRIYTNTYLKILNPYKIYLYNMDIFLVGSRQLLPQGGTYRPPAFGWQWRPCWVHCARLRPTAATLHPRYPIDKLEL